MKKKVDPIVGWIAQGHGKSGILEDLAEAGTLEDLKLALPEGTADLESIVFVPRLLDDDPDQLSDDEYFRIVNRANGGRIVRIVRVFEDDIRKFGGPRPPTSGQCADRCLPTYYRDGRFACECHGGSSGRVIISECGSRPLP